MNIAGKLFFWGICLLCCGNAGAELIPSKEIVVPAGCSRVSGSEYIVRVPKRSKRSVSAPTCAAKTSLPILRATMSAASS